VSDKDEYIQILDKIERDLEWIIQYLLKKEAAIQPSPYIPPSPDPYPNYGTQTICERCGMNWSGTMEYVCASRQDCPLLANWQTYEEDYECSCGAR